VLLAWSQRFQRLLARPLKSIRSGKGLSRQDFWKAASV